MTKKPTRPDLDYAHPLLDFPEGSGDKNCPHCKGRGVVPVMIDAGGGRMWPGGGTQNCMCVYERDLLINIKRVWRVLLNVESADDSPLLNLTKQNVWITASGYDLRQHLRFVAFRMGPHWDARVVADATLMTAWLSTKKNVFDADVLIEREGYARARPSEEYLTMVDLAVPFELLIVVLGVKAAANKEMANLLMEAINEREQVGKPTWIVDSPIKPLAPGHLCYNESVMEALDSFRRVNLTESRRPQTTKASSKYKARGAAPAAREANAGMSASRYGRKPGMAASRMPGVSPPASFDEEASPDMISLEPDGSEPDTIVLMPEGQDECDVDALLADAHEPKFVEGQPGLLEADQVNVEELLEHFPDASELGGNTEKLPVFLTGPPSKSEMLEQKVQSRYARRGHRNRQDDEGDE